MANLHSFSLLFHAQRSDDVNQHAQFRSHSRLATKKQTVKIQKNWKKTTHDKRLRSLCTKAGDNVPGGIGAVTDARN